MKFKNLRYEIEKHVGTITVDRPQALNAISLETMDELETIVASIERGADVRALIITGAGEKSFVAGGDLKEFGRLDSLQAGRAMALKMQGILNRLEALEALVIAAINGYAFGGGCEVAVACDYRIASAEARLGFRQVKMGLVPGWGGGPRLVRLVGRPAALRLLLTGDTVTAEEALRLGLVDEVHPPAGVMPAARALAARVASNPPLAVRYIKRSLHVGQDMPLHAAVAYEAELFSVAWDGEDHREAERAFLEKRKG